jgi:hypothetical protein
VLEGEMAFELEGEPPRVVRAGEAFWEPGGDVIAYQDSGPGCGEVCEPVVEGLIFLRRSAIVPLPGRVWSGLAYNPQHLFAVLGV